MPRTLFAACLVTLLAVATAAHGAWDPQAFSKESTLEILTVGPDEGEHWSTVWLVVIDGQVYVRLGGRATERIQKNTTKPYVKVRIAGQEFDQVTAQIVPDMVAPVAKAMASKYWSDVLIRHVAHPLTMRLTPAAISPSAAAGQPPPRRRDRRCSRCILSFRLRRLCGSASCSTARSACSPSSSPRPGPRRERARSCAPSESYASCGRASSR
jgi:hypothetical protein